MADTGEGSMARPGPCCPSAWAAHPSRSTVEPSAGPSTLTSTHSGATTVASSATSSIAHRQAASSSARISAEMSSTPSPPAAIAAVTRSSEPLSLVPEREDVEEHRVEPGRRGGLDLFLERNRAPEHRRVVQRREGQLDRPTTSPRAFPGHRSPSSVTTRSPTEPERRPPGASIARLRRRRGERPWALSVGFPDRRGRWFGSSRRSCSSARRARRTRPTDRVTFGPDTGHPPGARCR